MFYDYWRQHNFENKLGRIFNTYGPRMHLNSGYVVSNFIAQDLKGKNILIYGDGSQTRSFCYVDDLIIAMIRMISTMSEFAGPVNIGNQGEFTMLELAKKIIKLTGSRSFLVYQPLPSDDLRQRQSNIALAREILGWEPKVQFEEGFIETIKYSKTLSL